MEIAKPLVLPCGSIIHNRIAKAAMSENLSPKHHGPTRKLINAYRPWIKGGAGLIITGNIMIDKKAIAEPGNVLVEDKKDLHLLKEWAGLSSGTEVQFWPQINHPGRQAIGFLNKESVAPSAIKTNIKGISGLFSKPRALDHEEILEIIHRFGNTSAILKEAGFSGVQIHGAHGYLISQFLSPLSNQRDDQWGGSLENRMRFVIEVYRNIRNNVGDDFPVGIKINSADFQRGGFSEEESKEVVKILGEEGIDLIEVSGGTYEKPSMTGVNRKKSTLEREAYFMDYVEKIRSYTNTPIMLTGGFRTRSIMENAIRENQLDIIGMARPFTLYPNLPKLLFNEELDTIDVPSPKTGIKSLDSNGFIEIKWHEMQIKRLSEDKNPKPNLNGYSVMMHNATETLKKAIQLKFDKRRK